MCQNHLQEMTKLWCLASDSVNLILTLLFKTVQPIHGYGKVAVLFQLLLMISMAKSKISNIYAENQEEKKK